ncbi:MAG: phosphoribosyltransferase [Tissierellia bacterium]|nr:phosphoribosyltransferase [Tissierellia bacterium]
MESRAFTVSLSKNPVVKMDVIPGHFSTKHYHTTHYLGLSNLKTNVKVASDVAVEMALPYLASTLVDTIVCIEGTDVIGAYMARELMQEGTSVVNAGRDIHVLTPTVNINRKLVFQTNTQELIFNKNIILLVSLMARGVTVNSVLECLAYYGGKVVGISTLFNTLPESHEFGNRTLFKNIEVHSLFTDKDIPGYKISSPSECEDCKEGRGLDAIVLEDGYIKI